MSSLVKHFLPLSFSIILFLSQGVISIDYGTALTKSILYFEAQRSGSLPANQRVKWRQNSALKDGSNSDVDLMGGYYDAGDNVKFGFPMAFTTTILAWSVVEFGSRLEANKELLNAQDAVKWGTDYFIKAHPQPNVFYEGVGEGHSDHECRMRPEDMTTPRDSYKIDESNPGSDLAGETAAALAAASIAFKKSNPSYSSQLITHAKQLFDFAHNNRGKYSDSIPSMGDFYKSDDFEDELLWAAAWIYVATGEQSYMDNLTQASDLGSPIVFSWNDKYLGLHVLVAKLIMDGVVPNDGQWAKYKSKADEYLCSCVEKGENNVMRTPGGLIRWENYDWNRLQYVTTIAFVVVAYSDSLEASKAQLQCKDGIVNPADLMAFVKSQVDYILGSNPRNMSYMVGFGDNYPKKLHHRAASCPSIKEYPKLIECKEGFKYKDAKTPDPNVLERAVI